MRSHYLSKLESLISILFCFESCNYLYIKVLGGVVMGENILNAVLHFDIQ